MHDVGASRAAATSPQTARAATRGAAGDSGRLLAGYVRDHRAGATAGLALAGRCRRSNAGTAYEPLLEGIERDIAEDVAELDSIMARLGIAPSRFKMAVGAVAELVGRLKLNGRLVGYSPASRVVELEALAAGVATKRNLWRALRNTGVDSLPREELERLIGRANDQLERLLDTHDCASSEAFGTDAPR